MSNSSTSLKSAEARVAASRADIRAQVHALEFGVRRLAKSPYVVAGLVIGAASAGYFVVSRTAKPRAPASAPAVRGRLARVLTAAQMLLPLLGALGGAAVPVCESMRKARQRTDRSPHTR